MYFLSVDDAKFTDACIENGVKYIVKRNHRRESYDDEKTDIRTNVSPAVSNHAHHRVYYQIYSNIVPSRAKKPGAYAVFKLVEDYRNAHLLDYMTREVVPASFLRTGQTSISWMQMVSVAS